MNIYQGIMKNSEAGSPLLTQLALQNYRSKSQESVTI